MHVIEGATGGPRDNIAFDYAALRAKFKGPWIANNGYDKDSAEQAIASGYADMIAFGRAFIANPDWSNACARAWHCPTSIRTRCMAVAPRATPITRACPGNRPRHQYTGNEMNDALPGACHTCWVAFW